MGAPTAQYGATYDPELRPTDVKLTRMGDGATLFAQDPSYNADGSVNSLGTTTPGAYDGQQFCYDKLVAARYVDVERIPGVETPQTVFAPGAFARLNESILWLKVIEPEVG